jgi:FkbM family methyltransferase
MTRTSDAQCSSVWLDGVELDVDPRWASPAVREVIYDGSYEYAERVVLASSLSPDDVFLEVGAGLGLLATLAGRAVRSGCVVAIEANPVMAQVARDTTIRNGVRADVRNVVLKSSPRTKHADFYVREDFRDSSLDPAGEGLCTSVVVADTSETIRAVGATYLMVDIEGGEIEFFDTVLPECVRAICVDTHSRLTGLAALSRMIAQLIASGFLLDIDRCVLPVLLFVRERAR